MVALFHVAALIVAIIDIVVVVAVHSHAAIVAGLLFVGVSSRGFWLLFS